MKVTLTIDANDLEALRTLLENAAEEDELQHPFDMTVEKTATEIADEQRRDR